MKLAIVVLFSALLAFAIVGSCSLSHRSQDFACTATSQCATGRTCIDGYCVEGNGQTDAPHGSGTDAKKGSGSADAPEACPAGCTSCDIPAKTCTIDCALDGTACGAQVICPTGYTCTIKCDVNEACRGGIDCMNATACTITCNGTASCTGVVCGPGACAVECSGLDSCRSPSTGNQLAIDCSTSCDCVVDCSGVNSCIGQYVCGMQGACSNSPSAGCEDTSPGCNNCP